MFCFFGPKACGILALQPGIELGPPALEGEVNHWTAREVPRAVICWMWHTFDRY